MASNCVLTVRVSLRWWVMPYLHALVLFCLTTGLDPDEEKVVRFVWRHGVKVQPS